MAARFLAAVELGLAGKVLHQVRVFLSTVVLAATGVDSVATQTHVNLDITIP